MAMMRFHLAITSMALLALCTSADYCKISFIIHFNYLSFASLKLFVCFLSALVSANFSYTGPNGPANWGSLSPSFAACSNGKAQSPVDLIKSDIVINKQFKNIARNYLPTNATLVNNKFHIGVCSSTTKSLLSVLASYKHYWIFIICILRII